MEPLLIITLLLVPIVIQAQQPSGGVERLTWFAQCWADAGDISRNKVVYARDAEAEELGSKN